MSESDTQKAILDYLAARHVLAFRMQVGAFQGEHNGKKRFMRVGTPGMADILAFPKSAFLDGVGGNMRWSRRIEPLWIECKSDKGKQSDLQKSFQAQVEGEGHRYILARSVDDVEAALR